LPRSSNLTRPVDFSPAAPLFADGSAGPLGPGLAAGFGLSMLTLPF
jgi:hypothetical protein